MPDELPRELRQRLRSSVEAAGGSREAREAAFARYDAAGIAGPRAPDRRLILLDASDQVLHDERKMAIATRALQWYADPVEGEARSALFTHVTVGGLERPPPQVGETIARMACPSKRKIETFVSVLCANPPPGSEHLREIHASHSVHESIYRKGNFEMFCRMSDTVYVHLRDWSGERQVVSVSMLNFVTWALSLRVYESIRDCEAQLERTHAAVSAASKKHTEALRQKNAGVQKRATRRGAEANPTPAR